MKREAKKHGGRVESDGCGGYEVLAPDGRRWIGAEVWCYPLPVSEYESAEERQNEFQTCIDEISLGHEPYNDKPFDPTEVDRILEKIEQETR